MSKPAEYMTDDEQSRARVLVERRIRDVQHLHALMGDGIADYSTVWRYWTKPPKKKDIVIVAGITKALNKAGAEVGLPDLDVYDVLELLAGLPAGIRYFGFPADDLLLPVAN